MAYAIIYGREKSNDKRRVVGLVRNAEYNITKKTFDLNTATIKGICEAEIKDAFIFVLFEEDGTYIYSGFVKNLQQKDAETTFRGEDFKKMYDSDVLLDFSKNADDLELSKLFNRVSQEMLMLFDFDINISFTIAEDLTDTRFIADYYGYYLIINAMKFLKVYLSYFEYFIDTHYDYKNDIIEISFKKSHKNNITLRVKDFVHEKVSSDIKVNKTFATIKFETVKEVDEDWVVIPQAEYENAPNKLMVRVLPDVENYPSGFAIKHIENYQLVEATPVEYDNAINKIKYSVEVSIPEGTQGQYEEAKYEANRLYITLQGNPEGNPCTISFSRGVRYEGKNYHCMTEKECPIDAPSLAMVKNFYKGVLDVGTVIKAYYTTNGSPCPLIRYVKVDYTGITYYKKTGTIITPRPDLPFIEYNLGLDNNVYKGEMPNEVKIFPQIVKIHEAEYLADAQFNAVYSLVNNRWLENIILSEKGKTPISLKEFGLFEKVNIIDDNKNIKEVPVSEITNENGFIDIKLGFKKTRFTEIVKYDVGGR